MPLTWLGEGFDYPPDPETGVATARLTTSLYHHINVYCEHAYSSPDGRRIAILRSRFADPRIPPSDLLVADLYKLQLAVLEREIASVVVATASWSGWIYYLNNNRELMRVNLSTLDKEVVWTRWPFDPDFILHTVSPDLRFMVGQMLQRNFKCALVRIDLVAKDWKVIYEDYEISNAHPLYNPIHGRDISLMKAGGYAVNDRQEVKDLGTPRITTHFMIDNEGQNVRMLPLGEPYSPNSSGHSGWMGDTGKLACVCAGRWDAGNRPSFAPGFPDGNIFFAGPGDKRPRCFRAPEYYFNHIGVSRCGRYFVSESYAAGVPGPVPLVVGNFETGKYRPLLTNSKASGGAAAVGHPHAYFTADNKHVIYNADPTLIGHVWLARIPAGWLESLS
jgi:hypothetical protein